MDIAKALRDWAGDYDADPGSFDTEADLMRSCADEIDRLRATLLAIKNEYETAGHHGADGVDVMYDLARRALPTNQ